jgi:hypothetical protein
MRMALAVRMLMKSPSCVAMDTWRPKETWAEFDPKGTCFLPITKLRALMEALPAPLGLKGKEVPELEVLRLIREYGLHVGPSRVGSTYTMALDRVCDASTLVYVCVCVPGGRQASWTCRCTRATWCTSRT